MRRRALLLLNWVCNCWYDDYLSIYVSRLIMEAARYVVVFYFKVPYNSKYSRVYICIYYFYFLPAERILCSEDDVICTW